MDSVLLLPWQRAVPIWYKKAYAEKRKRQANRFNTLVVWLCFGSLVALCLGCTFAYAAIRRIAATQPHMLLRLSALA